MSTYTSTGVLAIAVAATLAAGATARAQDPRPTPIEGVTVVAPRITFDTEQRRRPRDGSAVPVEVTEATETVSTDGLDLTRTADLFALEERVEAAATRVCGALEQKYPEGEPRKDICVDRATDDAMARVHRMTRAAVAGR